MNVLTKTIILWSLFFTAPLMAGSGHDHGHGHSHSSGPVNQVKAGVNATEIVATLISKGKLDKSWQHTEVGSVKKITVQGDSEWVAVFVNKNISDTKKQKLYVFLTLSGDYIAANFTGK